MTGSIEPTMTESAASMSTESDRGVAELRVLTFNLWGIFNSKMRKERMRHFASKVGHYDVILLQEQFTAEDFELIQNTMPREVREARYFRRFPSSFYGSGCAVISRFPIVSGMFYTFPIQGEPEMVMHGDFFANKGVAHVTISVPITVDRGVVQQREVKLYTTHLVAIYQKLSVMTDPTKERYLPYRLSQVIFLVDFIVNTSKPSDAVIIGGDFNSSQTSLEVKTLRQLLRRRGYVLHSVLPAPADLFTRVTQPVQLAASESLYTHATSNVFNVSKTSYFNILGIQADIPNQIDHLFFSMPALQMVSFEDCPDVAPDFLSVLQAAAEAKTRTQNTLHLLSSELADREGGGSSAELDATSTGAGSVAHEDLQRRNDAEDAARGVPARSPNFGVVVFTKKEVPYVPGEEAATVWRIPRRVWKFLQSNLSLGSPSRTAECEHRRVKTEKTGDPRCHDGGDDHNSDNKNTMNDDIANAASAQQHARTADDAADRHPPAQPDLFPLSDHYGVAAKLLLRSQPDSATAPPATAPPEYTESELQVRDTVLRVLQDHCAKMRHQTDAILYLSMTSTAIALLNIALIHRAVRAQHRRVVDVMKCIACHTVPDNAGPCDGIFHCNTRKSSDGAGQSSNKDATGVSARSSSAMTRMQEGDGTSTARAAAAVEAVMPKMKQVVTSSLDKTRSLLEKLPGRDMFHKVLTGKQQSNDRHTLSREDLKQFELYLGLGAGLPFTAVYPAISVVSSLIAVISLAVSLLQRRGNASILEEQRRLLTEY